MQFFGLDVCNERLSQRGIVYRFKMFEYPQDITIIIIVFLW